ncbi:MAG: hypothetical protein NUW24_17215 [Anaerolineae bacterium]|jgi:predicted  nucleic acid-binding Zn-ribbon protein|nr:hypothetical protein [Anaerolineae bacterium]MDH7474204.1 hypothetical protein [Anaerolineae bacterium]
MPQELILIDKQLVERELRRVFDQATTRVLVDVLDRVAAQVHAAGVTRADFQSLREVVQELAQAQARTEARLEELAQAQARTEARLERLEAIVEKLVQAQARTEARLERLEAIVEELAQAQARTEARLERLEAIVEELAQAQARTEARLERLEATVGGVKGQVLELTYRERVWSYFGRLLRRLRLIPIGELEDALETRLSREAFEDLLRVDLLLTGQPRHLPEAPPVWLAVEVSSVVDQHDVERALRRAEALRQAGYPAVAGVAGEQVTPDARDMAEQRHVLLVQDGYAMFWTEALAQVLSV